ncbi:hypothetical protein [Thalassotalea sp. G2M2-11]|uniref:hypothetical protein n=1 Tax=Thalassotalea sp. G2M2-11 TaxID=2787627 RepID=UPI0019D2CB3C|nr:hypothetical protein [Thalassotalea sp. G2M2-11]
MTNLKLITSLITVSVILSFNSFSALASDCSITSNSKESVKCLQRKISKLENQLEQRKKFQVVLPKGAIVDFNAKNCPNGWSEYQDNQNGIVNLNINKDIIKCQKS